MILGSGVVAAIWIIMHCIFLLLLVTYHASFSHCNYYDPHLFPKSGPFFEGWYWRFIDQKQNQSFAILFGTVLPSAHMDGNLAFLGLLHGEQGKPLQTIPSFPPVDKVNITVKQGLPVTGNPDRTSPSWFTWATPDNGQVTVNKTKAVFNVKIDSVHFTGTIGQPAAWGPNGNGPAGYLDDLPLPLHWFVYSLHSPIINYKWEDKSTGQTIEGNSGFVHMEKNWGKSFPEAWIWTQGLTSEAKQSFALSYGPVSFASFLQVPGHLFGYRNAEKGIVIDFSPVNSRMEHNENGCNGTVVVRIYSLNYKIELFVGAGSDTFSHCLYGPIKTGFEKVAVESYDALAEIKVYKRNWFSWKMIDAVLFWQAALEFGGSYMCEYPCSSSEENKQYLKTQF